MILNTRHFRPFASLLGLVLVVTVSAAPSLQVFPELDQRLRLEWNTAGTPVLEAAGTLELNWLPVLESPVINGGTARLLVTPGEQTRFFRLRLTELTRVAETSPFAGETGVAVTRETILRFSAPLAADTLLGTDRCFAEADGRRLLARVELGTDRRMATLFFLEPVPANARVQVTLAGAGLRDEVGAEIDPDGDGTPGGTLRFTFDTAPITPVLNTAVAGHVFASARNSDGSNRPLAGVIITVDGAEETLRTTTDATGFFQLNSSPAGRIFVHIDGRAAAGSAWPIGAYYPFVGKAWETVAGTTNSRPGGTGDIFLPLIPAGALREVSAMVPTLITFTPETLAANPALAGVQIVVPANALYADSGARGGMVGIAPVPPDRLPEPLPPGLEMPLVITIQTDGPQNFAEPVPVRFPNLPDPNTGLKLPPGAKSGLWSFNHDTGRWEPQGGMTVSADGNFLDTDPGVGVRQPGWHGVNPGNDGKGPDDDGDNDDKEDPDCPDKNRNYLCDQNEPKHCRDKELMANFNATDCFNDITLNLAAGDLSWAESCAMGAAIGSWRVARDCLVFDLAACESSAGAKAIDFGIGCIPKVGGWIGSFKCAVETIQGYEDYLDCLNGKPKPTAGRVARAGAVVTFPQIPEYLIRAQRDLAAQIRLTELAQAYLAEVLGTERWNQLGFDENPTAFDGLVQALQNSLAPDSDGGADLSVAEQAAILALPRPSFATENDVLALINRLRQLQSSPPDPALRARMLAALQAVLAEAEAPPAADWKGIMDGGIRGLLTLAEGLEPQVGSEQFPARAHFYLLKDLETGFIRRGRLNPSGNFDPLVLPPNRLHAVMYFDPVENRQGTTLFRSGQAGGSTRILAARLAVDTRSDTDADGLSDVAETILGTSPTLADTDGDGKSDRLELADGTSPLDGIALPNGLVGAAEVPNGTALTVVAEGDVLYVGGTGTALTTFDLTQPRQPVRLGTLVLPGQNLSQALAVRTGLVALGGPQGLALVDARTPGTPSLLTQLPLGNVTAAAWLDTDVVALAGSNLYLVEGATGVQRLVVPLPESGDDVQVVGDFVYVLTSKQLIVYRRVDFLLLDTGRITVTGGDAPLETGRKLFVGGGQAYVGAFNGFSVVDVSNPASLTLLGSPPSTQAAIHDLAANDAGLLVPVISFGGQATLAVGAYDISNPADVTRFLTSWPTPSDCRSLTLHRGLAYVADTAAGVQVLNYLSPDLAGIAPTLTFTANFALAPARAAFDAQLRLLVDARDDVQVREVTAFVDEVPVAADGSFPFQLDFTAPAESSGRTSFTLRLRATDTAGNTRWTDPLVVALAPAVNPPRLLATFPLPVARTDNFGLTNVVVGFDQPLAADSITPAMLSVVGAGPDKLFGTADDVARFGEVSQAADPTRLEWRGTNSFPAGFYRVTLAAGLRGTNNTARAEPVSWTFEAVSIRPRLIATTPAGSSAAPIDGLTQIEARLDLATTPAKAATAVFTVREAGPDRVRGNGDDVTLPPAAVEFLASGQGFRLTPQTPLPGGRYRVTLTGAGFGLSLVDFDLRPVPNEWVNPAGGRWETGANWSFSAPVVNDFLRIPKLAPGLATTNKTVPSLARIESAADFVQELGKLTLTGEGWFDGLSRFVQPVSGTIELAGGGTIINRGTMQFHSEGNSANRVIALRNITLANRGRLEWEAGQLIFADPAARIFNEAAGTFDVGALATSTGNNYSTPEGRIINAGLLRKIAGTNTAVLRSVALENSGKILVSAGRLELGEIEGPGELEIGAGASVSFMRLVRLPAEARIHGDGDLAIFGGTTNKPQVLVHRHELTGITTAEAYYTDVRRALNHPGIQFRSRDNGWFRFFAPLTARRLWTSGASFGGIELNAPTTTEILQLDQGILSGPATIAVTESFLWTYGNIEAGGEITVQGTGELGGSSFGFGGQLNQRQLRFLPGTVVVALVTNINNSAVIGTRNHGQEGRIVNEGTFIKRGPGKLTFQVKLENRGGLMRFEEGRVAVERQPQGDGQLFLSGGELQFAGGELALYLQTINGATLGLGSGVISGYGRIVNTSPGFGAKVVNGALVRLNAPGKTIEIVDMGYQQTAAGELEVTLGAAGCGRLVLLPVGNDSVVLKGRLRVVLESGFIPDGGQSFILIEGLRSGTFAETIFPDVGPARKLEVTYTKDQVVMTVVANP